MSHCAIIRTGVALLVTGLVSGLGCLWWWALAGLSEEVTTAWGATSVVALFAGFITAVIGTGLDA